MITVYGVPIFVTCSACLFDTLAVIDGHPLAAYYIIVKQGDHHGLEEQLLSPLRTLRRECSVGTRDSHTLDPLKASTHHLTHLAVGTEQHDVVEAKILAVVCIFAHDVQTLLVRLAWHFSLSVSTCPHIFFWPPVGGWASFWLTTHPLYAPSTAPRYSSRRPGPRSSWPRCFPR